MNLRTVALLLPATALLAGCTRAGPGKYKAELVAADKAFSALSSKEGPKAACLATFSSDAKMLNQYATGAEGIRELFMQLPASATLTWEPAYVDAAASGDIGYTWGRYTLTLQSGKPGGRPHIEMGNYVTVWKRDYLGHWKAVLDGGNADGKK
jgi:ketosteroid isomerase-like protein